MSDSGNGDADGNSNGSGSNNAMNNNGARNPGDGTSTRPSYTVTGSGNSARISGVPYDPEELSPLRWNHILSGYDGFVTHLLSIHDNDLAMIVDTAPTDAGSLSWGIWSAMDFEADREAVLLDPARSAFHDGPAYTAAGLDALTGSATFRGGVRGHANEYQGRVGDFGDLKFLGSVSDFAFLGTVTLQVDFGDGVDPGSISGSISNREINRATADDDDGVPYDDVWDITLGSVPLTSGSAAFSSVPGSVSATAILYPTQFEAAVSLAPDVDPADFANPTIPEPVTVTGMTGNWQGVFRGDRDDGMPSGVTGIFFAANDSGIGIAGSFGATNPE